MENKDTIILSLRKENEELRKIIEALNRKVEELEERLV